jgi:NAD(P)-dependent dehydrogenase (short-subunit alcohol dehydrogenase family)
MSARPLDDLTGRRVALVGATGGIGAAVYRELRRRGARVLATGRRREALGHLEGEAEAIVPLDLADPSAAAQLADAIGAAYAHELDALVIAAGALGPIGPTRTVDLTEVERTLQEGPIAALALIQACASPLDAGRDPAVVLFSGGGATDAFPRYSAYALAKVAIVRLVENLAAEEPSWRVNAVAPGFVATAMHDATLAAGEDVVGPYYAETRRRLDEAVASEHAAELVAFLVGTSSSGITGRLVSAIWDPWREATGQALLREDASFGRLRRIDGQRYFERP